MPSKVPSTNSLSDKTYEKGEKIPNYVQLIAPPLPLHLSKFIQAIASNLSVKRRRASQKENLDDFLSNQLHDVYPLIVG